MIVQFNRLMDLSKSFPHWLRVTMPVLQITQSWMSTPSDIAVLYFV